MRKRSDWVTVSELEGFYVFLHIKWFTLRTFNTSRVLRMLNLPPYYSILPYSIQHRLSFSFTLSLYTSLYHNIHTLYILCARTTARCIFEMRTQWTLTQTGIWNRWNILCNFTSVLIWKKNSCALPLNTQHSYLTRMHKFKIIIIILFIIRHTPYAHLHIIWHIGQKSAHDLSNVRWILTYCTWCVGI